MSKNIITSNYKRAFPLTKDKTKLINYLRYGSTTERIEAICQIDYKKENYDLIFEIFLSDINKNVRHNALAKCLNIRKDKVWFILNYLIDTNLNYGMNDKFIVQIAKFLNKKHNVD